MKLEELLEMKSFKCICGRTVMFTEKVELVAWLEIESGIKVMICPVCFSKLSERKELWKKIYIERVEKEGEKDV